MPIPETAVLRVRDYFVYKDMYNPDAQDRSVLLREGQPGQDAFLLIALTLEERARRMGKLPADTPADVARRARMLDPRSHITLPVADTAKTPLRTVES